MFSAGRPDTQVQLAPSWDNKIASYLAKGASSSGLLTLGYLLITYILLELALYQPQGYVIDIYSELPLTFFLALIICYGCGTLFTIAGDGINRSLGILLLVFTHTSILLIPYLLGYYSMGRADDMWYIGEYLQISTSGTLATWDIYPASHIIGAILSMVTGLAPNTVSFIVPFVFSFLLIGGLVLCCRFFLKDQILVNIAIPASFILYLGPYNFLNVPHGLFFAVMPLFLFLIGRYVGHKDIKNIIIIIPFSLLIPFVHPYIVLFVVFTLGLFVTSNHFLKGFIDNDYSRVIKPLLLVTIGFLSWFLYSTRLTGDLGQSYSAYLNHASATVFVETTEKLTRINVDFYKFSKLLMVYYSRYTIPLLVILTVVVLLYIRKRTIDKEMSRRFYFFSFLYIALVGLEAVMFLNPLITHQPDRLTNLNFIVYAQVPLFVLSLYILFNNPKQSNRNTLFILLILCSTWSLGLFGALDSPNIFRMNIAMTHNEVEGMRWFYEERASEYVFVPLSQVDRFHMFLGDTGKDNLYYLPDHFGYNSQPMSIVDTIVDSNKAMASGGNVVLLTIDELLYQQVPGYVEVGRYVAADFVRFRSDESLVGKTYDTTDLEIYHIS